MQLRAAIVAVFSVAVLLQPRGGTSPRTSDPEALYDSRPYAEPLAIVVNKSNPVDDLSFAELRRVFLGERSHWQNGRRITIVMRDTGEPERRTILHDVCGMNEEQFKTHLLAGLFTGEILVSPKLLSSPTGVRKFVFNVPGAIGYLRLSDVDATVKVIRIDKILPDEKGYKLQVRAEAGN